jgi:hypothetical protein
MCSPPVNVVELTFHVMYETKLSVYFSANYVKKNLHFLVINYVLLAKKKEFGMSKQVYKALMQK